MELKSSFFLRFCENIDFLKIRKNHWKTNGFRWFFRFQASQKRKKIDAKTRLRKTSKKMASKSILASIFASQNLPKSSEIASQTEAKRSLFRDAVEPARKSSEINGPHSFWTTNLAKHMIRSSQSINQSINWSAPRRPNHQSKFCNL